MPMAMPAAISVRRVTCRRLAMCRAKVDTATAIAMEASVIQTS